MWGQRLGHQIKSNKNLVYKLEASFYYQSFGNIVRTFVVMILDLIIIWVTWVQKPRQQVKSWKNLLTLHNMLKID